MSGNITVQVQQGEKLTMLRLNHPERKNAISVSMWAEIADFAAKIGDDTSVRAVLLCGGDNIFSAGADITGFDAGRSSAENANAYDDLVESTCRLVEAIAQPTICVIRGPCIGAGASLAASCDLRIASENASFAVPAARLGLGYDARGIERFRRVFGVGGTTELLFTASRMTAPDALRVGAVHHVVPDDQTEDFAQDMARKIADNAPLTIRAAKLALRSLADNDPDLKAAADELARQADNSADYREGRAAFAEKRAPNFGGNNSD